MSIKSKRERVMINRDFQIGFVLKFVLINTLIMVMFGSFIYLFFDSEIDTNLRTAHVTYANMKQMLFPIVLALSLINILVSSVVIAVVVLRASHKIAGPLYRFREALDEIAAGNLEPMVDIRNYDQLYGCVPSLKAMTGNIAADISGVKEGVMRAGRAVADKNIDDAGTELKKIEHILEKYSGD